MAVIIESVINYETGELISCEVVGESDRQPMKRFVDYLWQKWWDEEFAKHREDAR